MDSDDLTTVKALRKAKKKEIQAWITAFEQREGRSPAASDKEAVRPMYREFKNLEAKIAALTAAEQTDRGDSVAAPRAASASVEASLSAVSSAENSRIMGVKEASDIEEKGAIRAAREKTKREIEEWIKGFEDREGHPPTSEDKNPIKGLYRELEDLERRLATSGTDESTLASFVEKGQAATTVGGSMANLEELKAEKKQVKREIQAWLDDFEAREGRSALPKDKTAIRSLYKRYKDLERKLKSIADEASRAPRETEAASEISVTSPTPQDRAEDYPDPLTPMILSPTSSVGVDMSNVKERESETANMVGKVVDDQKSDSPVLVNLKEELYVSDSNALNAPSSRVSEAAAEFGVRDTKESRQDKRGTTAGEEDGSALDADGNVVTEREESTPPALVVFDGNSSTVPRALYSNVEDENKSEEDAPRFAAFPNASEYNSISISEPAEAERQTDNKSMTAQEARVRRMRARFLNMTNLIEDEDSGLFGTTDYKSAEPVEEVDDAWSRWATLGDAVAPSRLSYFPRSRSKNAVKFDEGKENEIQNGNILSAGGDAHSSTPENQSEEPPTYFLDDAATGSWIRGQIPDLLLSDAPLPPSPEPPGIETLVAEASQLRAAEDPPAPEYVEEYREGVRGSSLVVASVGVEEVEARERDLELERLVAAREETNIYRAREGNLLHREDRARQRVAEIEAAGRQAVNAERKTVIDISIARERALVPAFVRARAGLEAVIRTQEGRVRELFGELRPGETIGARRFRIDWRGMPQPLEIRLHCIRAVRDRLPRGSYVMLSSMAEHLGGRVMRWEKGSHFDHRDDVESVDTDGGDSRPTASLPVKHGGRYFDRELRLDQSVYQTCPSKSDVRPGNVMVFELFRLAGSVGVRDDRGGVHCGSSRHRGGEIDEDTAVGWCVIPLADSRLRVIRGSFRVPMLRGEQNPSIGLHESLEKLVAADLEAWLGNLYLDIRHLPRGGRLEGGNVIGGERFDVEYDHVRKVVRLDKGLTDNAPPGNTRATDRMKCPWGKKRDVDHNNEGNQMVSFGKGVTEGSTTTKVEDDIETGQGAGILDRASERHTDRIQTKGRGGRKGSAMDVTEERECAETAAELGKRELNASDLFAHNGLAERVETPIENKRDSQDLKTSIRDQGSQETPKAGNENNQKIGKTPSKLTGAPQLVDSWLNSNNNGDHKTHANEILDEECLSDDDATRGSKFLFTPSGEAAQGLDMAAGCGLTSEGLRRRGEGARWDSAALGRGRGRRSRRCGEGSTSAVGDAHIWTPLTNPAEMEFYRFAVAADPGTGEPPTPAQVIRSKLLYMKHEVFSDLHPGGRCAVEYWLAVMVFVGALWLRVYLHALGQWLLLFSMGVPVFNFSPRLWEFAIKFTNRSSSIEEEVAFVWWGPTFVTLCFMALAGLARFWELAACGGKGGGGGESLPGSFSLFIAAVGVGALLDPYLLFLVDVIAGNHDCSAKCTYYTSPTCRCHEGDAWKLYARLEAEEGAGISGFLLTIMIYAMVSMATALIFYQYLLHTHMNGRMLDVWRRLNASEDEFFVPHDFEVSAAELQHACVRARKWKGIGGSMRIVVIHDLCDSEKETRDGAATGSPGLREGGDMDEKDQPEGAPRLSWEKSKPGVATPRTAHHSLSRSTTHVAIYDVKQEGKKSLHRQFLKMSDGIIFEVFGEVGREIGWQFRSSLNAIVQEEIGFDGSSNSLVHEKAGIFAGMLPVPGAVRTEATTSDGYCAGDSPYAESNAAESGIPGKV